MNAISETVGGPINRMSCGVGGAASILDRLIRGGDYVPYIEVNLGKTCSDPEPL